MLAKKNRLDKKQYNEVFSNGKTVHSPLFIIKQVKNTEDKRFSVVVPKKVIKAAHARNTMRRYMYDVIREKLENLPPQRTLFILKKGFDESKKGELMIEILKVLS